MFTSKFTPEEINAFKQLVVKTASNDVGERAEAMQKLIAQFQVPLNQGFFQGDTVGNIFTREQVSPGEKLTYPLDFVGPSGEDQFLAYFIPDQGAIPERRVVAGEVAVDTFELGNSIDWDHRYARVARYNVVERALEAFRKGFVMKINDEGWRLLIGAGLNRLDNQLPTSGNAFTLGLVSLMQLRMERGLEYSDSFLTDLYVSPEVARDIRNFATDQSVGFLQRDIFWDPTDIGKGMESDGVIAVIYGTRIHKNSRFGIGKLYNTTFNTLNNARSSPYTFTAASDEFVTGLDLSAEGKSAFWMPVRRELEMHDDPTLARRRKSGVWGEIELGLLCADNRRCVHAIIDR